jgi:hypothetical protein
MEGCDPDAIASDRVKAGSIVEDLFVDVAARELWRGVREGRQ